MKTSYSLLVVIVLLSCTAATFSPENIKETPKAFDQGILDIKSSRYAYSLVEQLFNQAMEEHQELKELQDAFVELDEYKTTTWQPIAEYKRNNDAFYDQSLSMIDQLKDTLLAQKMKIKFSEWQDSFEEGIAAVEKSKEDWDEAQQQRNDELMVLKLLVGQQMMQNYQQQGIIELQEVEEWRSKELQFHNQINELILKF